MASWEEFRRAQPDFADRVRARFDSGTNKTLATLRADGAPRISGTELTFADGRVGLGMSADSRKLADVTRDPRVAVHSPTLEPPADPGEWLGEAKLSGILERVAPPADSPFPDAAYFALDITEAALTYVGTPADHLVIESWSPTAGYRRRTRT